MTTDLPSLPAATEPPLPRPPRIRSHFPWPVLVSASLIVLVNVVVLTGARVPPFLWPALGFWFLLLQPVYLVFTTSFWEETGFAERLGYSLTAVLLVLMLAGLVADLVLPLIGLHRPLDPIPVVLVADLVTAGLYLVRRRFPGERPTAESLLAGGRSMGRPGTRLLVGGLLTVALAVLGANRLNNGAGDQVSLVALGAALITAILLLAWRDQVGEIITSVTLYLLSLGLLLMTSLRGWSVTGHDIQTEYQVFQLTQANGRWEIAAFHNAYNACLSITILPTEFADILRIDGPYVYKVCFQLIFAVAPVLVYAIARRYWSAGIGLLAAIYFISFPTFFTDMPFINRQEIGLLFVCAAVLIITSQFWSSRLRQVLLVVACAGVELSHYSSMYIFLGILAVAWVAQQFTRLGRSQRSQRQPRAAHAAQAEPPVWVGATRTIGLVAVLAAAVLTFAWGSLATQSAGSVLTDARSAFSGLLGHSSGARSGNVGYSLLFGHTPSAQQVLNQYAAASLRLKAATANQTTYMSYNQPAYPLRAVSQPLLPLTGAGRLLSDIGLPVSGLNTVIRLGAADIEQIFVAAGLIALLLARRLRKRMAWEFYCLAVGAVFMLVVVTVLPDLSVDYGVLRVFQESLIVLAPVLVAGSLAILRPLGTVWAPRIAAAAGLGVMISTTGLLPQVLGGYPAQLSLNNSGLYYDSYYMHPQEVAGTQWLSGQVGVLPSDVEATHQETRFLFTDPKSVTGQQFIEDAFPPLLRSHAWIILDYSVLHTGLATASYDGDLISYRYPTGILWTLRNLVYDNGGMEIYR
jgi:uncharacterized membrane protein